MLSMGVCRNLLLHPNATKNIKSVLNPTQRLNQWHFQKNMWKILHVVTGCFWLNQCHTPTLVKISKFFYLPQTHQANYQNNIPFCNSCENSTWSGHDFSTHISQNIEKSQISTKFSKSQQHLTKQEFITHLVKK